MSRLFLQYILFVIVIVSVGASHRLKAEAAPTEADIRARLVEFNDINIGDVNARESLLSDYMQFAKSGQLYGLQSVVAAHQANLKFTLGKLPEAEQLIEKYLEIATQYQEIDAQIQYFYLLSKIASRRSQSQQAITQAQKMLELARRWQRDDKVADAYLLFGQLLTSTNQLDQALDYLANALTLFEAQKDAEGISVTTTSIASLYTALNEEVKAIEYYQKALIYLRQTNSRFSESIVLFNIGLAYTTLKQYPLAKQNLEQALHISGKLNDELGVAYAQMRLAKIDSEEGNKHGAITKLKQALPIFEKSNDSRMVFVTSMALAQNYSDIGDYQTALEIHRPLLAQAKKFDNLQHEMSYFQSLTNIHANNHQYKAAYDATQSYIELLNAQHQKNLQESLSEGRAKFESEQKEKENLLLTQQNQMKQLRIEQQQRQNTINILMMALIALVAVVIGYLLLRQVRLRKMYSHMAMRDELTGTFNRRAILAYASNRLREARETNQAYTLAMLDLDWFKKFNDQYGHDVGDRVLIAFAKAAQSAIRVQDRLGRMGGEEWLYVFPDTGSENIDLVFNRVKQQLAEMLVQGLPRDHVITFSMGVASLSGSNQRLDKLIKLADKNLYIAKQLGRDRYVV